MEILKLTAVGALTTTLLLGGSRFGGMLYASEDSPGATTLNSPTPRPFEDFGYSVAVSGTRTVVGMWGTNAYVFGFASDTPTMPITLLLPVPAIARSVAISGPLVAVRVRNNNNNGANAYVYDLTSATPTLPVATLTNPSPSEREFVGGSVAISGTRVVVGYSDYYDTASEAGIAYVYDLSSGTPTMPVATLKNPSPAQTDRFGFSVAISGTRVVVGAHYDDTGAPDAGSVYVYDLDSGTLSVPMVTLTNPTPAKYDLFGYSVAISGTRVAIGASEDDTGGEDAGSVYIYDLASATPTVPITTLTNPNPALTYPGPNSPMPDSDYFGRSVAIFGTRVVVGARNESASPNGGSAYVYDLSSDTPTIPIATLTNPSPAAYDSFGGAVAIDRGRILVGAPFDDTDGRDAGSAYLYDFSRTLYVSQTSTNPTPPYATWDTAAHTIQEAVDAASDGDTVLVAAGEYALTNQITIDKAIVVRSESGPGQTKINGHWWINGYWGEATRCLWISNSLAVVDGLTIISGNERDGSDLAGGVVTFGGVLSNCIVNSRSFVGSGRLVYCSSGGLITDCHIGPNYGWVAEGSGVYLTHSQLRDCTISGMVAAGPAYGTGAETGAGVYAVSSTISGCTITGSGAMRAGGGAYLEHCEVDRCIISGNTAGFGFGPAGQGGGIFAVDSVIRNSLIAANGASNGADSTRDGVVPGFGGGVYLRGGSLVNCTVTGNGASAGGGAYVESGLVRNSILYFNSGSSNWYNAGGSFDHTCTTPDPGGIGNIVEDPQFVNRTYKNYRLRPTSPCIDVGANEDWMRFAGELDHNARLANGVVDLGAWESTNTSPAIVTQPRSQTVTNGSDVTFVVTANGEWPLTYGWRKDGTTIPNATNSTLTLFNVSSSDAGVYSVVVSTIASSTVSSNAVLKVISNMVPVITWIRPTNSTSMMLFATLNNPTPADTNNFAISVAVSGTRVVVGSPGHQAYGHAEARAYVYDLASATPATPVITLTNPVSTTRTDPGSPFFGDSVAIDGTRVLVGARGTAAYMYELTSAMPATPVMTLTNPSPTAWDVFGTVVGMSGTRAVIGARDVAYVYDLASATAGTPVATLTNAQPAVSELFGNSVAISGTYVVIGAALDDTGARDTGSAYVYDLASGTPTIPVFTLYNPGPDQSDQFGRSLAMSGSRLVVGTPYDADRRAGLAYVYDLASLSPDVPVLTLTNPNPGRYFGWSVCVSGTRVVVAAPGNDAGGHLYVYDVASSTPTVPIATLVNPNRAAGDWFGYSAAIDGATVVAAPAHDSSPADGGPIYVYSPEPEPSFTSGGGILLTVRATDFDGSVAFVEFFANSISLGRIVSSTDLYELVWKNAPSGTFQLHAEAVDDVGGRTISESVTVIVRSDIVDSNPRLNIRPTASGFATVSWTTAASGFVLQYSDGLSPANWMNAPGAVENPTTISTENSTRFYRLFRP